MRLRSLALFGLGLAGCAAPQAATRGPSGAPRSHDEAPKEAGALGGRAVFDRLVADVRRLHVFTPQTEKNLGRRWEDDLAVLAPEFERADTRQKLSAALERFTNALHDPHCNFSPSSPSDHLRLGFTVEVEWKADKPTFRVWEIQDATLRGTISEGDVVRSVDSVPAGALVDTYSLQSNANNRRGVARDVGHWLTGRTTSRSNVAEGQKSEWVFSGRDGATKTVDLVWKEATGDDSSSDFAVDYDKNDCAGLWPRKYGPYELSFVGGKYCVYSSKKAPFRDYPIVRQFSFSYYDEDWNPSPTWPANVDQRNLEAQLASLGPKGVILDLRDNQGGHNPNWFLDWWAPAGWTDHHVQVRLDEELRDRGARQRAGVSLGDGVGAWYAAQLDGRTKGQMLSAPRPFFCKPGPASDPLAKTCDWDNRYTPSHRVTQRPVALLVGPACVSSCDSVAHIFDENDFGPLVGAPTAAGYTTSRMKLTVKDASGSELGVVRIAISTEVSGKSGANIEAVPLHIDYPIDRTFDDRDNYDAALVDGALRGFREFRFPSAKTPVK